MSACGTVRLGDVGRCRRPGDAAMRRMALALALTTLAVLTACGGDGDSTAAPTGAAPSPSVTLSLSPTSVSSGGASTLTWSSTNATSCTASGSWTGSEAPSGSQSTGALTASATYTLSCSGTGGSASQSATVAVAAGTAAALAITSPSTLTAAPKGEAYSYVLEASGGTPPYTWSLVSDSGNGNTWNVSGGGVVSGTPSVAGADSLAIKVADSGGSTAQGTFDLTVNAGGAPLAIATPVALPNGTTGAPYATTIQASGGTPPYTWSLTSNSSDRVSSTAGSPAPPANDAYSINPSTGVLSYSGTLGGVENDYFLIQVTDSAHTTIRKQFAMNASSSSNPLVIATPTNLGYITQGTAHTVGSPLATLTAVGGTGPLTWSILSQTSTGTNNSWSINSNTGAIIGTATNTGTNTLNVQVTDGSHTTTGYLNVSVYQHVSGASRPAYNTSSGFFVLNGELYEPNGNLFRMRGVDEQDIPTSAGAQWWAQSGVNTIRAAVEPNSLSAETADVSDVINLHTNNHRFVVFMRYQEYAGTVSTGSASLPLLGTMVDQWVGALPLYSPVMNKIAINIANEWGPFESIDWQYAYQAVSANIGAMTTTTITLSTGGSTNPFANNYALGYAFILGAGGVKSQIVPITGVGGSSGAWTVSGQFPSGYTGGGVLWGGAIGILRAAGYSAPFVIDAGYWGQDTTEFVDYGQAVFQSDPQKNVVFSYHLYSGNNILTQAQWESFLATLMPLRTNYGIPLWVGEFGIYAADNGNNGAPKGGGQTGFPTYQVIQSCEKYGIGCAAWALDSGGTLNSDTGDNGFLYNQNSSSYGYPSNITVWGKRNVLDPVRGSVVLSAGPATSF